MRSDTDQVVDPESVEQWYFSAAGKWSSVGWPKHLYKLHIALVFRETTRHPEEVFLTGAAGFGIDDAWSVIYEEHSAEVIRCLRKIRVPGHEPYDLWTQAITKLLKDVPDFPSEPFSAHEGCVLPPKKIVEFEGRSRLKNYILLIAQNIGRDHLRRKGVGIDHVDVAYVSDGQDGEPVSGLDEGEMKQIRALLCDGLRCLTRNERCVLKSVGILGMSNKEAARMLGVSASSVTRYRQAAVESMKNVLESGIGGQEPINARVMGAFAQHFSRILQCLEDGPSV